MDENFEQEAKKMPEIDFSKVANMGALGSEEKKAIGNMKTNAKISARKAAKKKFNFSEAIDIPLPSKGIFYQDAEDENLRNGIISIRPMSLADEEILTNKSYLKNGTMFRVLFDTCVESNYDVRKLLEFDVLYIMYALRNISYGDDYNFDVECDDCGEKFEWAMNVSDIEWKELPEDAEDIHEIKLPRSKYTVTLRLSRLGDEEQVNLLKLSPRHEDVSDVVASLYVRTLSVRDERGNEIDPEDWIDFYTEIPTLDRNAINKSFEGYSNQPEIIVPCPKCGNKLKMYVPISADFFRVK